MKMNSGYISKMEENNKVPDKLLPQRIKDMLDQQALPGPVIEDVPKEEIKLSRGASPVLGFAAFAAVIALLIGGFAFVSYKGLLTETTPATHKTNAADSKGLSGVRGTTYKGLYDSLRKNKTNKENTTVQTDYIYSKMIDSPNGMDYNLAAYAEALRSNQIRNRDYGFDNVRAFASGNDITVSDHVSSYTTELEYGDYLFRASADSDTEPPKLSVYKLDAGNAEELDIDFFSDTVLMTQLIDKSLCEVFEYDPVPMVADLSISGNRLTVFFDYNLPAKKNDETYFLDGCGFAVYDISDMENVRLISEYEQPGTLIGIKEMNGSLFIVSQYTQCSSMIGKEEEYSEDSTDWIPCRYMNGQKELWPEQDMYLIAGNKIPSMMLISSFDIDNSELISAKIFQGEQKGLLMGEQSIWLIGRHHNYYENDKNELVIRLSAEEGELKVEKSDRVDIGKGEAFRVVAEEYNGKLTLGWAEEETDSEGNPTEPVNDIVNYKLCAAQYDENLEYIGSMKRDIGTLSVLRSLFVTVYHGRVDCYTSPFYDLDESSGIDPEELSPLAYVCSIAAGKQCTAVDLDWDIFVSPDDTMISSTMYLSESWDGSTDWESDTRYNETTKLYLKAADLSKYEEIAVNDYESGCEYNAVKPYQCGELELASVVNRCSEEGIADRTKPMIHINMERLLTDGCTYTAALLLDQEESYMAADTNVDTVEVDKAKLITVRYDLLTGKLIKTGEYEWIENIMRGSYPIDIYPYDRPMPDLPEGILEAERYQVKDTFIKDGYVYLFTTAGVKSYPLG